MTFKSVLFSFLFSLSLMSSAFAANGFMAVANVSKISGTVYINKEKIKEGAEIAQGMELRIPKSSDFVEVKFQNGHLVRFVGARVKVEDMTPKSYIFNLIRGKIYSAIKPLTQNETYVVKTKRASFEAKGSKFYIEESKKSSYLCVVEGVVATKSIKGEVDVQKDEDLTLANAKGELKATVAAKSMVEMYTAVFKEMGI